MAQEAFSIARLANLDDGKVAKALDLQIAKATADCEDRPVLATARKVSLTMYLRPVCDNSGQLIHVATEFEIAGRSPVLRSAPYPMECRLVRGRDGRNSHQLLFNPDALDDPTANTIEFPDEGHGA